MGGSRPGWSLGPGGGQERCFGGGGPARAVRAAPRRPHVAAPEAPEAPGMERARPGPSSGTARDTGRMDG